MTFDVPQDMEDLLTAVMALEFPSFIAKTQKSIGMPIEMAIERLPKKIRNQMNKYTEAALQQAFRVVLMTVDEGKILQTARNKTHKGLVVATGAVGGFFGGTTLALELPLSTGIMMRSVAEIAREEGEDLSQAEPCMACLSVLGLGTARYASDSGVHTSGYFHMRHLFAAEVRKAAEYLASNAFTEETAPFVARVLNKVVERFGIQLTEKVAAQLVPLVGAVSGATINYMFISHLQQIARGHFIVRRLERRYGSERVQRAYEDIYQRVAKTVPEGSHEIERALEEASVTREL